MEAAEENPGCALKLETDGTVTAVKASHTPGPWKLDNLAANGEQEIGISRSWEIGGASICIVDSSRNAQTLLADARLIAAAPELLEALKRLTKAMDDYDGDIPPDIDSPYHQARAVIAKATLA